MIKNYSMLDNEEKLLVCGFLSRYNDNRIDIHEVDNIFNKKIYGYGEGVLFYFHKERVIAKIGIVLEVVKELGTVYLHKFDICEDLKAKESIIKELIASAISVANNHGAVEILLGERNVERLKVLSDIGYSETYSALNMHLEQRDKIHRCLNLLPLSHDNKLEYLNLFNDAFSDMPHGSFAYIQDIEEYISRTDDGNYYFIVQSGINNIGFFNCKVENNEGCFDIGLCKQYRGRGYGNQLLETAIDFLNIKKVKSVKLIVIEKNTIAYNMYKKRGFKQESVLSYWIRLK